MVERNLRDWELKLSSLAALEVGTATAQRVLGIVCALVGPLLQASLSHACPAELKLLLVSVNAKFQVFWTSLIFLRLWDSLKQRIQ